MILFQIIIIEYPSHIEEGMLKNDPLWVSNMAGTLLPGDQPGWGQVPGGAEVAPAFPTQSRTAQSGRLSLCVVVTWRRQQLVWQMKTPALESKEQV